MSSSVEILGEWITLPDPDSVASLSDRYYGECTTLADAKSQLSAIGSPQAAAGWTGPAASAFAARLGALPGELEQAWESCNAVARALAVYSSGLRPVVAALRSLAYQAEEAQGALNATQAAHDQAVRTGQESATGVWNTKLAEAKAAVSALVRRRTSLLAELDQLSGDCVRQIHQASPENVHQDLLSDLKRYAVDAGHVGLTLAEDVFVAPFTELYHDVYDDALTEQWDWARYSNVLEDISGVLAVVALVVAPIPGLDVVDSVLVPASIAFSVAGTVAEGVALATGEKDASWSDMAFDVVGAGLGGGGRLIGQGLKTARLADGPEAHAAARAIWRTGKRNFFKLPDSKPLTVQNPLDTIKDDLDRDVHLGVKPRTVAWKHPFERAEWGMDKAGHVLDIWQAELKKKAELDQKSGGS